jgi:DNA primase
LENTNPSDNNLFREVAAKARIADVIAYYLGSKALIRKGKNFVCLCPFHQDHTPSMQIDVTRNTFHCFVDNHKGDSISFVEQYAKLSPMEALKKVCEICAIPLPDTLRGYAPKVSLIEQKFPEELKALSDLSQFYQLSLKTNEGKIARDYLEGRKIPQDVIDHFGIGYAPLDDQAAIQALRSKGYSVETLERAGILANSTLLKDHYSQKVMFPIQDNQGHTVAFSGRRLLESQPGGKYINYPESPLFEKRTILYHYDKAKETARQEGFVYVVEGFMDVIALVRAGINSVVGTMGTALTEDHIKALLALKVEIRMALDSDEPGRTAIERSLPLLTKAKANYRIQWAFKGGKDADEILTRLGKNELLKQINVLVDPVLYLFGRRLEGQPTLKDTSKILSFLRETSPYYQALDPLSQANDLAKIASRTGFDKDKLLPLLRSEDKPQRTTDYSREKRRNDTYKSYRKDREEIIPIDISRFPLGPSYNEETAVQEVQKFCLDYCRSHHQILFLNEILPDYKDPLRTDYLAKLVDIEVNLALVLPESRQAFMEFENNHNVFVMYPLYVFACLVGSSYLANPDLMEFSPRDYQALKDLLQNPHPVHPTVSLAQTIETPAADDAFDLDGIEGEGKTPAAEAPKEAVEDLPSFQDVSIPDLSKEDREIIFYILSVRERILSSRYDKEKYLSYLRLDKTLLSLYYFLKSVQEEKGGLLSKNDTFKLWEILGNLSRK